MPIADALTHKGGATPLFDGLGSERTVTKSGGSVTASSTTTAFGQAVAGSTGAYGFGATSGYRGDGDGASALTDRYGDAGDDGDGLLKVGARYYDPATGSFLTRDTDLSQSPYAYCDADPVNATDPSGHAEQPNEGEDFVRELEGVPEDGSTLGAGAAGGLGVASGVSTFASVTYLMHPGNDTQTDISAALGGGLTTALGVGALTQGGTILVAGAAAGGAVALGGAVLVVAGTAGVILGVAAIGYAGYRIGARLGGG